MSLKDETELKSLYGPIYGVKLLDSLALDGGMSQALPSRADLIGVKNTRVVAGYEVLLMHYQRLRAACRESASALNDIMGRRDENIRGTAWGDIDNVRLDLVKAAEAGGTTND